MNNSGDRVEWREEEERKERKKNQKKKVDQ
jgi:hypothetical protein